MPDTIKQWLSRAAYFFLVCLLALSCYFVLRLGLLVRTMDRTLVAISGDMQQVLSTAADISSDVTAIRSELHGMKDKMGGSIPVEEAKSVWEAALAAGRNIRSESSLLGAKGQEEIEFLLRSLSSSGVKFDDAGKLRSAVYLGSLIYTKYLAVDKTLTSTEDFIERVASRNILGQTYYITDEGGNRTTLREWMLTKLAEQRGGSTPDG